MARCAHTTDTFRANKRGAWLGMSIRPFSNRGSLIQQFRAENLTSLGKEGRLPVLERGAGGFELLSRPCGEVCADEGIG